MIDNERIAVAAAEFMDCLEREFGQDATLGVFAIVAEVDVRNDGDGSTVITYTCSDNRRWIQSALFTAAETTVWEGTRSE